MTSLARLSGSPNTLSDVVGTPFAFLDVMRREKAVKFKKSSLRTTINWDLYNTLAGLWEDTVMDDVDEEYDHFVHHLRDSANGAESLKTTKRRLSPEAL
ncbi:unnamed protein product [Heligmosomoides polygyrus]|uniref:DUF3336 domain-containing protein n=1 Tax=Heligmosomoides polygyrus TaxID=6339 RepID=A0A183G080_HELPZ|nr:unnamed protein product [Heligmosomoides polygyrus]